MRIGGPRPPASPLQNDTLVTRTLGARIAAAPNVVCTIRERTIALKLTTVLLLMPHTIMLPMLMLARMLMLTMMRKKMLRRRQLMLRMMRMMLIHTLMHTQRPRP